MQTSAGESPDRRVFEFEDWRLDAAERQLRGADGDTIALTPKLFSTLIFLVERSGQLVDKHTLLDAVWAGVVVEENTLSRTISALRRALGERGRENRYIATVPGVGYRFVAPVTIATQDSDASAPDAEPSVAVLPFEDLSPRRDQQYFADGIAVEVLNCLAQIGGVRVIARTSSFMLRDAGDDPESIGNRLGVDHLLAGSIRKDGSSLRISVRLIEVSTHRQLWSRQFDRRLEDVFAVQEEIARAVTRALGATVTWNMRSFASASAFDREAYDLFLRGLAAVHESGPHAFFRALASMREALDRDPDLAPAWLAVAAISRGLLIFAPEQSADHAHALVEAANKATELVPDSWAAHVAAGAVHHLNRDWGRMEESLRRAAALVPRLPPELGLNQGTFLGQVGDTTFAIERLRQAVHDDPLSLMASSVYQTVLNAGDRFDEADAEYERSLALPGSREVVEHAALHRAMARDEDCREALQRHIDTQTRLPHSVLTQLCEAWDRPDAALQILRDAIDDPQYQDPIRQMLLAWWFAHYGDVDSALAGIRRACIDNRFINIAFLWYPVLSDVRRDPRFKEILREVGLVYFWRARGNWGDYCRPLGRDDFECR